MDRVKLCLQEFSSCFLFQAPNVKNEKVYILRVVVQGEYFLSKEETKVMIRPSRLMTFVQTDKPIYIPGQTVHFRVITLDTSLKPVKQPYDVVELKDANENRIGQWKNLTARGSILQLSHPLNAQASEGFYTIAVWTGASAIYESFMVEKYVLPKFEIKITHDEVNIGQKEHEVRFCALYTYGTPVPGKAELDLCRPLMYNINQLDFKPPCVKQSVELDQTGCGSHVFNLSIFMKEPEHKMLSSMFTVNVKVEEEGTGVTRSEIKQASITYVIGKVSFVDTPKIYEHGSIIKGKIKVVDFNNKPISHMLVYLFEQRTWPWGNEQNLTTDPDGFASFSINTTSWPNDNMVLTVSTQPQYMLPLYKAPYFRMENHVISVIQAMSSHKKTSSSLSVQKIEDQMPCEEEVSITVQYTIIGENVPSGSVDVIYLAISRGMIVQQGHMKVPVPQDSSVTEGEVTFKLTVVPEMAPLVRILVYGVLPSETVIAHSMNFPTEKCFRNKVSVEFSPSQAVPGEKNTLHLSAQPGSLCGLSAVDQSVHIKAPGKKLNAQKIFDMLAANETPFLHFEDIEPAGCLSVRPRRHILSYTNVQEDTKPYHIFQKMGIKMATNLVLKDPHCLNYKGNQYFRNVGGMSYGHPTGILVGQHSAQGFGGALLPSVQTVRTFFPETWIWDLVEVGDSGSANISLKVPDTITSWETAAFCLASSGFGLASPVKLNVFQPFFIELILPYSIIRGENFKLKATVFNYLSKCIMVSVTPADSLDYTLTPSNEVQYSSCLCANERKTFSWTMSPSVLGVLNVSVSAEAVLSDVSCDNEVVSVPERGRIDTVTRRLLVKAEGTEKTDTYNWLLCPTGGALTEEVDLQLPKNVVEGSDRASLSVLGDILGRPLKNLDGLLQMPYGCGEQNMALLAPNIYILEYLNNTEQLTPAIRDRATAFLTSGYQRQLNYKHRNGPYSSFGQGTGNTLLTAFVLRSFGKAKSFIFIDPQTIEESMSWLKQQQDTHGCFKKKGKFFNNRMKGGVTDKVTLTAYITASMLELNTPLTDPAVNRSLSCLRNSTSDLSNTYTTALLAYTFTLARDMEMRTLLLQHLDKIAVKEWGLLHWSQTSSETSASLAVEISSYVLLASLNASPLSTADLGYASRIVRWLVRQQNSYGGFSSTQDTVVGLQALALYSTKVFMKEGASTVTIQTPRGGKHLFEVNQNNKLLYQERELKDTKGKYSMEVKGNSCASVQVSLSYNIPTPTDHTTLSVQVTPVVDCNSNSLRSIVTLEIKAKYHGSLSNTNMVIVDVKTLSGFVTDPESLRNLITSSHVQLVDIEGDHVLMYLEELTPQTYKIFTLDILQDLSVQNLKPAVVKIYDYYQPSDQAETEYIFPCK